jgi:aspartate aminotransferase-like enzyme
VIKNFVPAQPNLSKKSLQIAGSNLPYFRTQEFDRMVGQIKTDIKELFNAKKHKVALLTASGTGAMDCVLNNFLTDKDRVLVISVGRFGKRWVELCNFYNLKYDYVGSSLEVLRKKCVAFKPTVILMQHNETSTMELLDIEAVGKICKANKIKLVVDASSSIGIDPLNIDSCSIDVLVAGTQKGLGTIAGLSVVVYNRSLKIVPKNYYLDLTKYKDSNDGLSLPFTPNIVATHQLAAQLTKFKTLGKDGLKQRIESIKRKKEYFYSLYKGPKLGTSSCGSIIVKNIVVKAVVEHLKKEGIYVCPSKGLDGRELTIGHIGELSYKDIRKLVGKIQR